MASVKEIKGRIGSIQDTMKITNAMYMISSSKMTRAKKTLAQTEPFFFEQRAAVARMMKEIQDYTGPYFGKDKPEEEKVRGYVVITGDKGLAGAYNHNVLKLATDDAEQYKNVKFYSIGETGRHFFENKGYNLEEAFRYTVQDPSLYRARNITTQLVTDYLEDRVDEIYVVYTKMENAFRMNAEMFRLLPLDMNGFTEEESAGKYSAVTNFHPSVSEVMDNLIPNIVAGSIYGALVESYASEHNSRMMAMQNATDNAKEILHELGISFNRARQAAITQEITEVVAGAKAQKNKKR
ncbi:MAG: ATP synthase F1 subunit gamma [Eubacterium sp.]|nr:ATP synthase F1 subunit gamma [Eubacterium sp.]MBQ9022974.1 ATP synthase F1 subunit gamma [Eubacterium sp.]